MKPIYKFNGGKGATLCHNCRVIIVEKLTNKLYCGDCMRKPTEKQKEAIDFVIREMKSWKRTNDITSPTHYSDIDEFFNQLDIEINNLYELRDTVRQLLNNIKDIE